MTLVVRAVEPSATVSVAATLKHPSSESTSWKVLVLPDTVSKPYRLSCEAFYDTLQNIVAPGFEPVDLIAEAYEQRQEAAQAEIQAIREIQTFGLAGKLVIFRQSLKLYLNEDPLHHLFTIISDRSAKIAKIIELAQIESTVPIDH